MGIVMLGSPSRLLRGLALVLMAGAIAAATSACGSTSATLDPVAQAADVTSATGGVHMQMTLHANVPGLGTDASATGSGFFNYGTREGKFAIEVSGLPALAAKLLGSGPLRVEDLVKGSSIYLSSPLFAGDLPGGARWVKVDLSKVGAVASMGLPSLTMGVVNPAQILEYLRAHGGSITTVGSETLDGVPTTRYRVTLNLAKVAEGLPESERSAARAAIEQLSSQTGVSSVPFDVWIDGQQHVRRIEANISTDVVGQHVGAQLIVNLSGFGQTPTVTAPAASEVFSGSLNLLGG